MDLPPTTKIVPDPDHPGKETSGTVMRIREVEEPFAHARLEDGTVITSRMTFTEIVKLLGRVDKQGNPKYQITMAGSLAVYHPGPPTNGEPAHG